MMDTPDLQHSIKLCIINSLHFNGEVGQQTNAPTGCLAMSKSSAAALNKLIISCVPSKVNVLL